MKIEKIEVFLKKMKRFIKLTLDEYTCDFYWFWVLTVTKKVGRYTAVMRGRKEVPRKIGEYAIRKRGEAVDFIDKDRIVTIKNGKYRNHDLFKLSLYFDSTYETASDSDYSRPAWHYIPYIGKEFYISEIPDHPLAIEGYTQKYKLRSGDIVFDCGAFCGTITYLFSKMVGEKGKVIAFEPGEANYQDLLKNIERHGLTNVIPLKKALWWFDGRADFIDSGLSSTIAEVGHRLWQTCGIANRFRRSKVECISLKTASELFGMPSLIKMDIEGAELEVIKKSTGFLRKYNANFAIASYHIINHQQTRFCLPYYFKEAGYETETGFPEHLTTWAWKE